MSKIVVGYDGSESAKHALERAATLANGDAVTVVSAVHPMTSRSLGSFDPVEAELHERHLEEAKNHLSELGVSANAIEEVGDPAAVIANAAETMGADLIVVGSEGKNLLERLLEGSVSTGVTKKAKTDVLVVH